MGAELRTDSTPESRDQLENAMTKHISDEQALQEIQEILSAEEWDSDTPSYIAEVMARAGYEIKDTPDLDEEADGE